MSMNTKHTPGPWHVTFADPIRQPDVLPCIDAPDAEVACGVFRDADACLIAAAPDLLAALQCIVDSEPLDGDSFVCDFETLQSVARAAIAKVQS